MGCEGGGLARGKRRGRQGGSEASLRGGAGGNAPLPAAGGDFFGEGLVAD